MKKIKELSNGITLISLVISIIVLLILAGVTIAMLTGENGILKRAVTAKNAAETAEVYEQIKLAYAQALIEENVGENKTFEDSLKENLESIYGTGEIELSKDGENYYVKISGQKEYAIDTNGSVEENVLTFISVTGPKEENATECIGCYVSIDEDDIPDGIIYADLGKGGSGTAFGRSYSYAEIEETETDKLKTYVISNETINGSMGRRQLIKIANDNTGEIERFHIMKLTRERGAHWYKNAAMGTNTGTMTDYTETNGGSPTSVYFGKGFANTNVMKEKCALTIDTTQTYYGEVDAEDMWAYVPDGWYVPSVGEWAAFLGNLGINSNNIYNFGIGWREWTSSQCNSGCAYCVLSDRNIFGLVGTENWMGYHLGTTF